MTASTTSSSPSSAGFDDTSQDFHTFLAAYRAAYPDDVLTVREPVAADQDPTALVWALAAQNRHPAIVFENVAGLATPLVTNLFASRERVGRMLGGVSPAGIHAEYQARSRRMQPPRVLPSGAVTDIVQEQVDLSTIPAIRHFATDRGPYITNAILIAEDPETGIGNASYHRSMLHSPTEIATSLHSRGHLWRMLQRATEAGRPLPVAMVVGAHPLFMLAGAARLPYGVDERHVAGGLFGAPLEVVRTPRYGIAVPAHAEIVLEGVIDPSARVEEGPFGEFTGYSSDRSTNNLLHVETVMRRRDAWLVDVVGGNSAEHLNLGRIPRESEMVEKLRERFPGITAVHYPSSGTHFHAYVALRQSRPGEARQVMLGLLGWDPYLKTVVAVDEDVDITRDEEVLWAIATHLQPHLDVVVVDGLPGSALDPSASGVGTTSRMGLDATRGPAFDGIRARIDPAAMARATALLARLDTGKH
ncbi:4-hydroxy-3-polyprenylbenzoate decarboxylase [Cupriavidus sp. OV038]|jgi:4-hydroxy-3-polyprenylbenzoate decarboxylase|uniref:UbiD family decarboxylase n=1 Tax=unclassified Cupriavidus TaxID=2640874 RepID=UPI0008E3C178|nr:MULTISPECIES: UbiD family decarboxylase [unclassified Cupriavidus]SFC23188.1 4-hydroxy-3-polyprenylbenzoate decarboxylase [Cupriavidus sp. OV038]SFP17076.1 4-hydroxy-3-polyprenylbenzoate decarboxylase [Cupriavidus sp. OV096]